MKTYSITDTGALREMNQDYFFASDDPVGNLPNLYIVADGMGGHKAGDYASRYTTQRVVASVSRDPGEEPVSIIKEAINTANKILIEEAADAEDVNVVALSLLSGAHNTLFPEVVEALKAKGMGDVLVVGGGVIPESDIPALKEAGVKAIFTPGTPTKEVIDFIKENVK